jgi:hypothetical protein
MLTIFAIPKPFRGHDGVIQTNAIQSWTLLQPTCEIMLFGDEEGTAAVATKFGIRHIPDVERNKHGTPLVSSLFEAAQNLASHDSICYVNADIILMSDFVQAIRQVEKRPSLVIGRRWDLDVKETLDFNNENWETQLRVRLAREGKLHGLGGIDYFLFPRGTYRDIPSFAIGRYAWDNWLIYKVRSLGLPVIDATQMVTIVHQNHDYAHITSAKDNRGQLNGKGIESERNRELLGGIHHAYKLLDATYRLTPTGLKSTMTASPRYLVHRVIRLPEMHPYWIPLVQIIKGLRSLYYSLRSVAVAVKRSVKLT